MWKGTGTGEVVALVLTYHSISAGQPPLCMSRRRFEAQLDLLARAGFEAVSFDSIVAALEAGRELPDAVFALTFDDAYRDFADHALPILERRGLPAMLFATTSPDRDAPPGGFVAPLLEREKFAALTERGVEIGAHSVHHSDLTVLDDADLEQELLECRSVLEHWSGRPVKHFAYPFGYFDARVRAAVARQYRSACTTQLAAVPAKADPYAIPRLDAYYLRSRPLRWLLAKGRPEPYLRLRRWLRLMRGTERRRRVGSPHGGATACR
jgi:peptidoglycan/xylan/chitin deacetylase (PgdA/CDA1 family)